MYSITPSSSSSVFFWVRCGIILVAFAVVYGRASKHASFLFPRWLQLFSHFANGATRTTVPTTGPNGCGKVVGQFCIFYFWMRSPGLLFHLFSPACTHVGWALLSVRPWRQYWKRRPMWTCINHCQALWAYKPMTARHWSVQPCEPWWRFWVGGERVRWSEWSSFARCHDCNNQLNIEVCWNSLDQAVSLHLVKPRFILHGQWTNKFEWLLVPSRSELPFYRRPKAYTGWAQLDHVSFNSGK